MSIRYPVLPSGRYVDGVGDNKKSIQHTLWILTVTMVAVAPIIGAHGVITKHLTSLDNKGYFVDFTFPGTNQTINFLIDTGSANTALPCQSVSNVESYYQTALSPTFHNKDISTSMQYTSGAWDGVIGSDFINVLENYDSIDEPSAGSARDHNLEPVRIDFTCIKKSKYFFIPDSGWIGILGLAYGSISSPDATSSQTFMSTLSGSSYAISNFAIDLCGYGSIDDVDQRTKKSGKLSFGVNLNTTTTKYLSIDLFTAGFYEIVIYKLFVGITELNLHCQELNIGKTIIDSGTHDIFLPKTVFRLLVELIKLQADLMEINQEFLFGSTDLCWSESEQMPFEAWPTLSIIIIDGSENHVSIQVLPEQYIYKVPAYDVWGQQCYHFGISPSKNGDTILGEIFLEGLSVIFDYAGQRLLFGNSTCIKYTGIDRFPRVDSTFPSTNDSEATDLLNQCTILKESSHWTRKLELSIFYACCAGICLVSFAIGYMLCDILNSRKNDTENEEVLILKPINLAESAHPNYGSNE